MIGCIGLRTPVISFSFLAYAFISGQLVWFEICCTDCTVRVLNIQNILYILCKEYNTKRTIHIVNALAALQATGPLRQAMGPPWSGAGVGVGMLRGAGDSLT